MARRNFVKMIEDGRALALAHNSDLFSDEAQLLYEKREDPLGLMASAYYAGVAEGYKLRKREERKAAKK